MKNSVVVVWMCWWIGFCLCYQPVQPAPDPQLSSGWRPPQHGSSPPSASSVTSMVPKISRSSPHPVPGVNEDTQTMNKNHDTRDTIHGDSSTGGHTLSHLPPPPPPPPTTNNNNNNNNNKPNTDENLNTHVSEMNNENLPSPAIDNDNSNNNNKPNTNENLNTHVSEMNNENLPSPAIDNDNSNNNNNKHNTNENLNTHVSEINDENLPSPAIDNNNNNKHEILNTYVSAMNNENNERPAGSHIHDHESHKESSLSSAEGRPESHGRVITMPKELCSFCLCNTPQKNVICEHEHTAYNDIHELILDHLVIPRSAETLRITGFERVHVKNNTFYRQDLKLRVIQFENIPHLELETNSLHFSEKAEQNMEVVIILTKCNIKEMPQQTFTQMTSSDDPRKDVNLEETRFMTLKLHGCHITTMRSYALYNARLLYFEMTDTKVEVMEENSIHVDTYEKWTIERSRLPNMVQKSVSLRAQDVVVFSHNTFMGLANRSLDILSASQVLFEFNTFHHLQSEALLGIRPYDDKRAADIVFLNNTIIKADESSLMTSKKYPMHERKIIANKFNVICNCNIISTFEKLMSGMNSHYDDPRTFKEVIQTSFCLVKPNTDLYIKVKLYADENCTLPITVIVAGSAVGVVLLILVIVCVVCTRRLRKAQEEANYLGECCVSQSFSTLQSNNRFYSNEQSLPSEPSSPLQPWIMAVPEVKTYKETELNVAYENTEPMKTTLRHGFHPEPGPLLRFQCKAEMRSSCPFN